MRSGPPVLLVTGLVTALLGGLLTGNAAPAAAVAPPAHTLEVTGPGVGSYPAYDPAVERYAVTTTQATGGTLTVHATTTDSAGVVRVDGRVAPGGTATLSGLAGGDEVSVFIEDSAGTEVHSLVYLPVGFPALELVATSPAVAPGQIGLTLNDFRGGPQTAVVLDRNGVPAHVETITGNAIDLKQQPNGNISISKLTTTPGRTGSAVVEMNHSWQEVSRQETVGLTNTDSHDSILLPDGSRWLIAYEYNLDRTRIDAVIQEVSKAGDVLFQWSSANLAAETVVPSSNADYAHINSIALAPDGDIIASFRHLSAVLKIATSPHDGFAIGDVVWKLGGRDSSFAFVDDPLGGPCAQHAASMLPNGHVLLFDDGSDQFISSKLCVDQADPTGPAVERVPWQSRVAEYALDFSTPTPTATLVWDYTPAGRYTWFMGSAARLGNGDTLIGWAASLQALASEVDADGNLLWELRLAPTEPPHPEPQWTYRASLMHVPDAISPSVVVAGPAEGAEVPVGQPLAADFSCTDVGGSSLQTCGGTVRPGGLLDTSTVGLHTVHLTATDGAGNTTAVTRSYTVTATYQPRWTDDVVRTTLRGRHVTTNVTVVNDGTYADTFTLLGTRGSPRVGVRYKVGSTDVTHDVRHGLLRTPVLQPGQSLVLRVVATRTHRTRHGSHRTVEVRATSLAGTSADVVTVKVRAR